MPLDGCHWIINHHWMVVSDLSTIIGWLSLICQPSLDGCHWFVNHHWTVVTDLSTIIEWLSVICQPSLDGCQWFVWVSNYISAQNFVERRTACFHRNEFQESHCGLKYQLQLCFKQKLIWIYFCHFYTASTLNFVFLLFSDRWSANY